MIEFPGLGRLSVEGAVIQGPLGVFLTTAAQGLQSSLSIDIQSSLNVQPLGTRSVQLLEQNLELLSLSNEILQGLHK